MEARTFGNRRNRIGALFTALALAAMIAQAGVAAAAGAKLDVNRATAEQLEALPGIGPAKAAAILEERSKAPFRSVEDLERVKGIGPGLMAELRDHVTVASPADEER